MKYLFPIFLLLPLFSHAQKFYVEKSDNGADRPIINKLLENRLHVVFKEDSADYTIRAVINEVRKDKARGYLLITDAKGEIVAKTEQESATSTIYNGLQDPKIRVVNKIVDRNLMKTISAMKK